MGRLNNASGEGHKQTTSQGVILAPSINQQKGNKVSVSELVFDNVYSLLRTNLGIISNQGKPGKCKQTKTFVSTLIF